MTYATTFSGIGGWEIGLNACGWDLQWQCEREPWCQALLRERFGMPIYGDITTLTEANPPKVDALIGPPPCQPFSVAGAQRGTSDERHLYPSFLRAVRFLEPRWVLMEQVPAILSLDGGRVFGQYIAGLAALGYDLVWHCLPACAIGAPHRRDRVWIIAHPKCQGLSGLEQVQRIFSGEVKTFSQRSYRGLDKWNSLAGSVRSLRTDHGLSLAMVRREIHGYGNAVIPQIPYIIGQAINEVESQ